MGGWNKAGTEGGSSFPFPAVFTPELLQSHALKRKGNNELVSHRGYTFRSSQGGI